MNVSGDLYVLVGSGGNNQFHGTAERDGNYLGTKVVDGESHVGSFVDPAVRGEVTWVYTTLEGVPAQETGYLLDYNPSGFPGVGAHRLTIVARLALCYLPFL